ncbi:MAG TPA: EAL domain-containing protein [Methylophilaceae bacterium]|jgi:diguanylate cyclase (GGDEF)-like protein/PAS domain S-box-containing protein
MNIINFPPNITTTEKAANEVSRLLIVDDDIVLARSLQQLTELVGYQVKVCNRGVEALALLALESFDLLLLDLVMPGMDGHAVIDNVRRDFPQIPIIVVTATGTVSEAAQSLEKGVYDFIRKPYEPAELLRTIENALAKSQLERIQAVTSSKLDHYENLNHYLVDSSPDIIYTLDEKGRFTFVNKRVFSLLGYLVDELIGEHYSMLVYGEDIDAAKYAFRAQSSFERATYNVELRLRCQSDREEYRYFDISFIPILNTAHVDHIGEGREFLPLKGSYGVARDITERKKVEYAMAYQAHHDMLTGLPNRTLFNDRLEISIAHARRNHHRLAVLFLDLDRFKWVNDTLGHIYGDELLKNVASRLKSCLREGDTLARIGGDEFTIILPEVPNKDDVPMVARKILATLEQAFVLDNREINISASIGVAIFPDHGDTIDALTKSADIAMYHVKWKGKNGFMQYDSSMDSIFHQKMSIESDLRKAIENNELELYFQPQVDVNTLKVVGLEALTRWHHEDRGWIPPAEFIPLAEEAGLISMLTYWLIKQVTIQHHRMQKAGFGDISIAVNVSPESVLKHDFVSNFLLSLRSENIANEAIEIEITENIIMQDMENSILKLNELSRQGVKIAIDDFGTGYSSLAYLQKLPMHSIKLDQTFVHNIQFIGQELPIVSAIIGIAKGFNLKMIAEGVETTEQMQVLKSLGCSVMQGYLFSKPLPMSGVLAMLRSQDRLFA